MKTILLSVAILALGTAQGLAGRAFVSNERGNTITVVNTDTWEVETEFFAGGLSQGLAHHPAQFRHRDLHRHPARRGRDRGLDDRL